MSLPFLTTIGLTEKESELYELLIKLGESPAQKIIKESKLKRATAYKVLYSLEEKGLLTHKDIEKKIHFRPEPPAKLFELAEARYHELERAKNDLRSTLPQMNSNYILSVERPVVTTYEGVDGLKQIYEDTLREKKPIYAVLTTQEVEPKLFTWLTHSYVRQRVRLNIPAKVIVASGKWSSEYLKKNSSELRETRMVSAKKFPFEHEVDIYGDKVAYINYKKGQPLIGLIIANPLIARTMRAWFDLAWKGSESYSPLTCGVVEAESLN